MQDVIGWFNPTIDWLNANSPAIQVALVLTLVCVTWSYARHTKRLVRETRRLAKIPLELHKQAVRERHARAIMALAAEANAITGLCDWKDPKQRPVDLPRRSWESMIAEILLEEVQTGDQRLSDAGLKLYVQVLRCNALYEGWKPFATALDGTGRPSEGTPAVRTALLWVKERDKLHDLMVEFSKAVKGGGNAQAESADQA